MYHFLLEQPVCQLLCYDNFVVVNPPSRHLLFSLRLSLSLAKDRNLRRLSRDRPAIAAQKPPMA